MSGLPKSWRSISLYAGVDLNEDVALLQQVLKDRGTTLGKALRPELERLIRQHRREIDTLRKKIS